MKRFQRNVPFVHLTTCSVRKNILTSPCKIARFKQTIDIAGFRQYLRCMRRNRSAGETVSFISVLFIFVATSTKILAAQSNWKEEWNKTLRAAEAEGELTLYGCCYEYDRIVEEFKKKHPKIKVTAVLGAGGQLGARVLAERRGEKYLPDVFSAGANTIHDVLYKAQALEPIKSKLILPEVIDASRWYEGEHRYIDPEQRYIFAFVANSQTGQVQYNRAQVNPTEFSSFWDLLNPKWKGKIASLDLTTFGMGAALQFFYYHPDLGPAFLRKLYGEMQVTVSGMRVRRPTGWCRENFPFAFVATPEARSEKPETRDCPSDPLTPKAGKRAAAPAQLAEPWAFRVALRIPMRQKCSSTGFFPARDKSRCRNSVVPTLTTRAGSTFRKMTSILTTA